MVVLNIFEAPNRPLWALLRLPVNNN